MAEIATIARPYAEALAASIGAEALAAAGRVDGTADRLDLVARVATDPQVKAVADDPHADTGRVQTLIEQVAGGADGLEPALRNLLQMLVANRRLAALPAIAAQFREQANRAGGVADALIQTAYPLDGAQLADLQAALERRFGRRLKPRVVVEPSLIGGVRVAVGDEVLDTSVQARLAQMRTQLTA